MKSQLPYLTEKETNPSFFCPNTTELNDFFALLKCDTSDKKKKASDQVSQGNLYNSFPVSSHFGREVKRKKMEEDDDGNKKVKSQSMTMTMKTKSIGQQSTPKCEFQNYHY